MLAVLSSTLSPGTAKPIPALLPDVEMIIVLMPTTSPFKFNSGPPEFPGLIAAPVCMQFLISFPATPVTDRPNAETNPDVMVRSRPNGLPMASRDWPTSRSADEPYAKDFNDGDGFLIFSTATSNSLTTSTISHGRYEALLLPPPLVVSPSPLVPNRTKTWAGRLLLFFEPPSTKVSLPEIALTVPLMKPSKSSITPEAPLRGSSESFILVVAFFAIPSQNVSYRAMASLVS
mmetsp:Transcript_12/g.18  ORF Transcript_12/g.18 Transcript_12/m.18 type:complete len:232 (+) Transcript_12:438-1133(+)